MSLALLQELSPNYTKHLVEGLHILLVGAAEARDYNDVSILSSALDVLKAQESVTEVGYRNGEVRLEAINEDGAIAYIESYLQSCFDSLPEGKTVSSYMLIAHTERYLEANWQQVVDYEGPYSRTFWKVCFERAIEKLLNNGLIKKVSRYVYAAATPYSYDPLL